MLFLFGLSSSTNKFTAILKMIPTITVPTNEIQYCMFRLTNKIVYSFGPLFSVFLIRLGFTVVGNYKIPQCITVVVVFVVRFTFSFT